MQRTCDCTVPGCSGVSSWSLPLSLIRTPSSTVAELELLFATSVGPVIKLLLGRQHWESSEVQDSGSVQDLCSL